MSPPFLVATFFSIAPEYMKKNYLNRDDELNHSFKVQDPLLSFSSIQKKVTKENINFRTQLPSQAFPALVCGTGLTEPLRGYSRQDRYDIFFVMYSGIASPIQQS